MIPRNRPVINEAEIAQATGTPLATWRRRDAPAFRERVPGLFPRSRILLYDRAQAHAYLAGKPVPALPTDEHPDDLLNDHEAAELLGVRPSTVRAYATQGYLPAGTTVYGLRVWTRHQLDERRTTPPRQGQGGGRRPGEGTGPRKAHPYENDPRLHLAAKTLKAADANTPRSRLAAALSHKHGGSTRTWERLLAEAGNLPVSVAERRDP